MAGRNKKILSIIISLQMVLCGVPVYADASPAHTAQPVAASETYPLEPNDGHMHLAKSGGFVGYELVEPTCTAGSRKGYVYRCYLCGTEFVWISRGLDDNDPLGKYEPPLGHQVKEWQSYEGNCGTYKTGYCTRCEKEVTEGSPDHDWGSWTITEKATCVNDGLKTSSCKKCQEVRTETIPATGIHSWTNWNVTKDADCTTPGSETRECEVCKKTETKSIPAKGHSYAIAGTLPSCDKAGEEYMQCKVCNYIDETTRKAVPATGHIYEDDGDCTTAVICKVCKETVIEAKSSHDFDTVYRSDDEHHWQPCRNPGCEAAAEKVEHELKFSGDCTKGSYCTICGATGINKKSEHSYSDTATPYFWSGGTEHIYLCTNDGCKQGRREKHIAGTRDDCTKPLLCAVCNAVMENGQKNHNFSGRSVDTDQGHVYSCQNLRGSCVGEKITPHSFIRDDGNCTTAEYCTICGRRTQANTTHNFGAWQDTLDGKYHYHKCTNEKCTVEELEEHHLNEATGKCIDCGADLTPHTEHIQGEFVRDEKVGPTCELGTMTAHYYKCAQCGEEYIASYSEYSGTDRLPANGHTVQGSPDCVTHEGECGYYYIGTCIICQKTGVTEGIEKAVHNWSDWTEESKATCGTEGKVVRTCPNCGKQEEIIEPATGEHTWSDWNVTEATCTAAGSRTRECTVCHTSESEIIPVTEHQYALTGTLPTCTVAGSEYMECTICGDIDKDTIKEIPATGHTYEDDGDCTTAVKCDTCGEIILEARQHNFSSNYFYDETTHWTGCENEGCTVQTTAGAHQLTAAGDCTLGYHCDICGAAGINAKTEHSYSTEAVPYISGTEHVYLCTNKDCIQGRKEDHTPAVTDDCTEPVKCTVCEAVLTTANEEHTFGDTYTVTAQGHEYHCLNNNGKCTGVKVVPHTIPVDDSDCTTAVKCSVCGYTEVEAHAAHDFDDWEDIGDGYHSRECKTYGCEVMEQGEHDIDPDTNICKICRSGAAPEHSGETPYDEKNAFVNEEAGAEVVKEFSKDGFVYKNSGELIPTNGEIVLSVKSDQLSPKEQEQFSDDFSDEEIEAVYDIALLYNGSEIEPNGIIRVTITTPTSVAGKNVKLYRREEDGTFRNVYDGMAGRISFYTDHLSIYILSAEKEQPPADNVPSSPSAPSINPSVPPKGIGDNNTAPEDVSSAAGVSEAGESMEGSGTSSYAYAAGILLMLCTAAFVIIKGKRSDK